MSGLGLSRRHGETWLAALVRVTGPGRADLAGRMFRSRVDRGVADDEAAALVAIDLGVAEGDGE